MNDRSEKLPPVPTGDGATPTPIGDPLKFLLNGITSIAENGMEEVARVENGVTIRPEAVPLLYTFEATSCHDPLMSTVSEFEIARVLVTCNHNHQFEAIIGIPTQTLLELIERAAVHHPLWAATLLSHLHTVKELFKTK